MFSHIMRIYCVFFAHRSIARVYVVYVRLTPRTLIRNVTYIVSVLILTLKCTYSRVVSSHFMRMRGFCLTPHISCACVVSVLILALKCTCDMRIPHIECACVILVSLFQINHF